MSDERSRTPIIALTANAVAGMKEMYLKNGFDDYLSKPIETTKLDSVLKKWLPFSKRKAAPSEEASLQDHVDPSKIVPSKMDPSKIDPSKKELPELAGVDMVYGLAQIGGSKMRYLELLETFRRDVQAGMPIFEKELEDLGPFTTQVHALKSALGNIGSKELSQTAALLEKAASETDMLAIRENLPAFLQRLSALIAEIDDFSSLRSPNEGQGLVDEFIDSEMRKDLTILMNALQAKDFELMESSLERLRKLAPSRKMSGSISEIEDHILIADFQKAIDLLTTLLNQKN
jgi:HPt (histidine-containing phosphotransfer) domain-containing protein